MWMSIRWYLKVLHLVLWSPPQGVKCEIWLTPRNRTAQVHLSDLDGAVYVTFRTLRNEPWRACLNRLDRFAVEFMPDHAAVMECLYPSGASLTARRFKASTN